MKTPGYFLIRPLLWKDSMKNYNFNYLFDNNKNKTAKAKRLRRGRVCRIEELESREMLSVSLAEFDAIRGQYADLNLSANMANYNIIEIQAENLSAKALQSAIDKAAKTVQNDLIVIRTTLDNDTIRLLGNPLTIDIDSARFGSVAIVSLGTSLTVDTQSMSGAFRINSGNVALGGVELVGEDIWLFKDSSKYGGLIAVRGQSTLVTSALSTSGTPSSPTGFERNDAGVGIWDHGNSIVVGMPYGATTQDTSEYMVGSVYVTLVLMESTGSNSTLDWSDETIRNTIAEVRAGLDWWEAMFDKNNPQSQILLTFYIDITWAVNPCETSSEPTSGSHTNERIWGGDFLKKQSYSGSYDNDSAYLSDMRKFNDAQRKENGTDWAFTAIVVNGIQFTSSMFAYAWVGGPNLVMTYENGKTGSNGWGIGQMQIVLAHEVGHIFWALDEYAGAKMGEELVTNIMTSGYYNVQNTNGGVTSTKVDSIMADQLRQTRAYGNLTSSPASLQMVGWRDSNGNGILDMLDTAMTLSASGRFDESTGTFFFNGMSSITTLPNKNKMSGNAGHNITLNTVDKLQYKLDNGQWITLEKTYGGTTNVGVSASVALSDINGGRHTIYFRTICERTGATSEVWSLSFGQDAAPTLDPVKPKKVKANSKSATLSTVTLTWAANSRNVTYKIICTSHPAVIVEPVFGNSVTISGLNPGTKYKFSVIAINQGGKEATKVNVTAKTKKYASVKGLKSVKAKQSLNSITITWKASPLTETTGYIVEVYDAKGKTSITLTDDDIRIEGTTATITGLSASTRYTFVVKAVAEELGIESAVAKTRTSTAKYLAVKKVKVASKTSDSVNLYWEASKISETNGYEIVWLDGGVERPVEFTFTSDSETSAQITNLSSAKKYTFLVRAVVKDADGNVLLRSLNAKVSVKTL